MESPNKETTHLIIRKDTSENISCTNHDSLPSVEDLPTQSLPPSCLSLTLPFSTRDSMESVFPRPMSSAVREGGRGAEVRRLNTYSQYSQTLLSTDSLTDYPYTEQSNVILKPD